MATLQTLVVVALLSSIGSLFASTSNSKQPFVDLDLDDPTRHNQVSNDSLKSRPGSATDWNDNSEKWFSPKVDTGLSSSSVLYGMIRESSPLIVGLQCHSDLQAIGRGIHLQDVWAMKMLDASATGQSGFVWGNNLWLGSRQLCESFQNPKQISISSRFEGQRHMKTNLIAAQAPFPVGYRVAYATHQSQWQIEVESFMSRKILHVGLCVPTSCGTGDLMNLSQSYLDSNRMELKNMFVQRAQVFQVKDFSFPDEFYGKTSVMVFGCLLLVTAVLTIMAAYFEQTTLRNPGPSNSLFHRLIGCFNIRLNFRSIVSTYTPPTTLPAINAFKSVGCLLLLYIHLVTFSMYTMDNSTEVFALGEQLQWQYVSSAMLMVDIFFIISGMLLAYNFLRNEKRCEEIRSNNFVQNARLFGKQFLHRYLRLMPFYLVVLVLNEIITSYLTIESSFWIDQGFAQNYRQHWWRDLLHIQNLYPMAEMCAMWSWSLACEMQFFVMCLILLFVYVKHPAAGRNIFLTLTIGFGAIMMGTFWRYQFTNAYDVFHYLVFATELYRAPWVRVLPYLLGLGCGWYLHSNRGESLSLAKRNIYLISTLAVTVITLCSLTMSVRYIDNMYMVPITVVLRWGYMSGVCWILVACGKGHGGWFTTFTNSPVFVHIGKLSYGIYLLNPIVISFVYGSSSNSITFDPIVQITMAAGIQFIVYQLSFVGTLLFEVPYTKLSAEISRARSTLKVQ